VVVSLYVAYLLDRRVHTTKYSAITQSFEGVTIDIDSIYKSTVKLCKCFFLISIMTTIYIGIVKIFIGFDRNTSSKSTAFLSTAAFVPVTFGLTSGLFFLIVDVKITQSIIKVMSHM